CRQMATRHSGPPPPSQCSVQPLPYGYAAITGSASCQSKPVLLTITRWFQNRYELTQSPLEYGVDASKTPYLPPTAKRKMQSIPQPRTSNESFCALFDRHPS